MRVCPHCHQSSAEDGAFCPACGKPWSPSPRPAQPLIGTFLFPPAVPVRSPAPAPLPAPAQAPPGSARPGERSSPPPTTTSAELSSAPHGALDSPRTKSSARITVSGTGAASSSLSRQRSPSSLPPLSASAAGPMSPPTGATSSRPTDSAAMAGAERGRGSAPPPRAEADPGATAADSLPIPDPRLALVGTVVDGFAIDEILGSGGCGTVYRGRQLGLDRPVAIKVPTFDVVDDPVLKKRFLREARAAARVRHPSVVTIYGVGEVPDGRPYLAMELLDGVSLAQVLDDGPLPVDRALALARKIALALAETHAAGVVHRDLKPSNIIWRTERGGGDHITIVDFGIAAGQQGSADATRLTAGGKVIGTPHYMAPEQAQGEHRDIDHRTDLYALGCVLFELLTAEVPFDGTGFEVVLAHMTRQPPAPSSRLAGIPPAVDELVAGLMKKRSEERIGSAEEVVRRIDEILATLPTTADRTEPSLPRATTAAPEATSRPPTIPSTSPPAPAPSLALAATAAPLPAAVTAAPLALAATAAPLPATTATATTAAGARGPLAAPSAGAPSVTPPQLVPPGGAASTAPAAPTGATWRSGATLAALALIAALAAVTLYAVRDSASPRAPDAGVGAGPAPAEPAAEVHREVMLVAETVSMRLQLPARLTAGTATTVELELWNDGEPLTGEEVVITVQDPTGKFTGFNAKAERPEGYTFRHVFAQAGRYLMQVNLPVGDTTFEVDVEVAPAA